MWQFWQRGCWSTTRIVSNAATPAALEPAELGVTDKAIPLANKIRLADKMLHPKIEACLIFMA